MKSPANELPIPHPVHGAEEAHEVLRVWTVDGNLAVNLNLGGWRPGVWGIALVDIARHVACGLHELRGVDPDQVMAEIRRMFDAEWDKHTSTLRGGIVSE